MARVKGNPGPLFGAAFYPPEAALHKEQGTVGVELSIDAQGSVSDCRITQSSGSASLDAGTCTQARQMQFYPARTADGEAVPSTYPVKVKWSLESR